MIADLEWLACNTVPIPGERAAALESWSNVLRDAGIAPDRVAAILDRAERSWRDYPWRHTDGNEVRL